MNAIGILTSRPEILDQLFVTIDYLDNGFATIQFFINGSWNQYIIDTKIPWDHKLQIPLFGRTKNRKELWVPLLERAYAKVKGN